MLVTNQNDQPAGGAIVTAVYSGPNLGQVNGVTGNNGRVVNEQVRTRDVTNSPPGSRHDLRHVVESQVIDQIPEDRTIIGDADFYGLQNHCPGRNIVTTHKARRDHPLTPDQKLANYDFSSVRIVVENIPSDVKHFQVLAHQFRHTVEL